MKLVVIALVFGLVFGLVVASSGCVYRINIQQGNLLDEEIVSQIKAGMTRSQIRFLLGTPMVEDSFHSNRWDYVYYFKQGKSQKATRQRLVVFFDEDIVSNVIREESREIDIEEEGRSILRGI